jgi:hypothetical protein
MRIKRKFFWGVDYNQQDGWIPQHMPSFDAATTADTITHDVLEHLHPADGSVESELLAFGTALYFRCDGIPIQYLGQGPFMSPIHLGGSIAELLYNSVSAGKEIAPSGYVARLAVSTEKNVEKVRKQVWKTLRDFIHVQAHANNAINWMRKGYRLAGQRYMCDPTERVELFFAVLEACQKIVTAGKVGDKLEVEVTTRPLSVRTTITN